MSKVMQVGRQVLVSLLCLTILSACAGRSTPPASGPGEKGSAIALQSVAKGLKRPLGLYHAGDGSGRLYILEQDGHVRLLEDGKLSPTPFLDISDRVLSEGNEQGLLGLAFHPDYRENGTFFVHYTGGDGAGPASA